MRVSYTEVERGGLPLKYSGLRSWFAYSLVLHVASVLSPINT